MDGHETLSGLKENHYKINILALSMYDGENSNYKKCFKAEQGYILKDCDPSELQMALQALVTKSLLF